MKKTKIKESAWILKSDEDTYHVLFSATRVIKTYKVDSLVKGIISGLSNNSSEELDLIKSKLKDYNPNDVQRCLEALENQGIIRTYEKEVSKRFVRQALFIDELTSSWDETIRLQNKLENSVVSVFGVGGIGTWVVNGLYQIGIGEIRITDPDVIEESNLNRQLFFDSRDIGRYKVDVIKEKLPDAKIVSYKKVVSEKENLEEMVLGSNFLVNCADSPSMEQTTKVIDEYSRRYDIPYCLTGGYNMHLGMLGPIMIPNKTVSFYEFIKAQKSNDILSNMETIQGLQQTGNLGPIAGTVANMQVMEIFKYIIGKGSLNINKFAEIDFMNFNIKWINFGQSQT